MEEKIQVVRRPVRNLGSVDGHCLFLGGRGIAGGSDRAGNCENGSDGSTKCAPFHRRAISEMPLGIVKRSNKLERGLRIVRWQEQLDLR